MWRNAAATTTIVQIATVEASVTIVKVVTLVSCIARALDYRSWYCCWISYKREREKENYNLGKLQFAICILHESTTAICTRGRTVVVKKYYSLKIQASPDA